VVEHSSGGQSVVLDGVPSKPYGRIGAMAFNPDSKHLAYRAIIGNRRWVMVVDGKEVGQYESSEWHLQDIVFSPDSSHLAYVAGEKLGSPEHRQFVVLDGDELTRHKGITGKLVFSPDSKHLVYNADGFIFVDDIEKGVWNGAFIGAQFSPDSTRLAYVDIETGFWSDSYTAAWIVIDGVKGKKYHRVGDITFSLDSKHVAYIASQGKKQFVVVDEEKGKEYDIFGRDFGVSVSKLGLKRIIWDSADSFHYLAQKDNGIYLVEETITEQ
jgi:WD40 repeat protein